MAISDRAFEDAAKLLKVDIATIRAVAKVEGGGAGILNGKPIILFEPHVFYRLQKNAGVIPEVTDICYPVWGTKPYPKTQDERWAILGRAIKINRNFALRSTSWGMFQILGMNYSEAGCDTVQGFVNAMYKSEDLQLTMFINYLLNTKLVDELQHKDWKMFAQQYNGKYYWKNSYDVKLAKAFNSFT